MYKLVILSPVVAGGGNSALRSTSDVPDWDTLAAKGHDRGAVFHLPELDE